MPRIPRRWRLLLGGGIVGVVLLLRLGGGDSDSDSSEESAELSVAAAGSEEDGLLSPCPPGSGVEGGLCGVFEVPEDRANPDGRRIGLNILVLPASEQGGEPDPVFILAGGPGQAATDLAPLLRGAFAGARLKRDFVFVDQRGTGESNELHCEFPDDAVAFSDTVPPELTEEHWRECLESLDADLEHYTTPIAMDDLEEVRVALGYGPINLWGGSYGTRAASVFMRRHPESVRSVVLDGVAPVDMRIPLSFAADGQRALNLLLDACAADAECDARFPRLGASVDELLRSLEQDPPRRFRVRHPRTGEWEEVPLTREAVASILRFVLYSPNTTSLVPLMIESALDGDFGPLVTFADPALGPGLAMGMFLSVLCAEDLPFIPDSEAANAGEESFLGDFMVSEMKKACAFWPRGELPEGYREPVRSDAPVLILSGELDPVTPPRWGDHAAETLPNARHVVVPGTGHGTLRAGCVPLLIEQFFDSADASALEPECLDPLVRPPFWPSATGPVTTDADGDESSGANDASGDDDAQGPDA